MLHRIPVDLTVPSLEALAYVLRHREHWPAGFVWDYSNCWSCAIGVSNELWNAGFDVGDMCPAFSISRETACFIFLHTGGAMPLRDVTPEMVADQIDLYLRKRDAAGGQDHDH